MLITVQKRESLMQKKNNGKEEDIRGGGKELFSGWSHLEEKAQKIFKPTTQFILAFKK